MDPNEAAIDLAGLPLLPCKRSNSDCAVEKAVLLTVNYQNIFSCAPSLDTLHTHLIGCAAEPAQVQSAVRRLQGTLLVVQDNRVMWPGRESLAKEAQDRAAASRELWRRAEWIGRLLRAVPFVRMVGVTGSVAMNHASRGDDLDLLCIATRNRVWLVVAMLRVVQHLVRRIASLDLCVNCVLDESDLEIRHQNLYLAHQISQLVPLWGGETYERFLTTNRWFRRFLPNSSGRRVASADRSGPSVVQAGAERVMPRAILDMLNRSILRAGWRRALAFYRTTHSSDVIAQARNGTRYMLPGLGYGPSVYRRFMDGHLRLAGFLSRAEMEAAFGAFSGGLEIPDRRLDAILARHYNHAPSVPSL